MTLRTVFHPPEITSDESPLARELAALLTRAVLAELPADPDEEQVHAALSLSKGDPDTVP